MNLILEGLIKYLKHNEIDKQKWDECLNQAFNGTVYAVSWYLDLVHDDWDALVENDYERVMPLTSGKKFGFYYLYQPFFTQQLGVFSKTKLSPEIVNEFLDSIPDKFKLIEINLNSFNRPTNSSKTIILNKNYVLDLINPYEKTVKKYATNTKRNLKKTISNSLFVSKNIKPEELIILFRGNRGSKLKKWGDGHYQILQRLMYTSIYKGKGVIYGVYGEFNELNAGAFFLKNNNRLIFLFSGVDETARKSGAMSMLIDHVIKDFSGSRTIFDFEGSNDKNLARFYKGFGAKETTYPGIRLNNLPFPVKQLFSIYKRFKNS